MWMENACTVFWSRLVVKGSRKRRAIAQLRFVEGKQTPTTTIGWVN
jgi:hypothetical protein